MTEKYIMMNLDDAKTSLIAEMMSNKTAKRILALLAEKEYSKTDIAKALAIPLNTAHYNVQKLLSAGLIEKSKNFFWSVKGKRIATYKVSNKKIVISPRSSFSGIIPALIVSVLVAIMIKLLIPVPSPTLPESTDTFPSQKALHDAAQYEAQTESGGSIAATQFTVNESQEYVQAPTQALPALPEPTITTPASPEIFFILGALTALVIFLIWNWRKVF